MSAFSKPVSNLVGGITGSKQAAEAAEKAGRIQAQSAQAGIDETRRQFDKIVELMAPFVGAGSQAVGAQGALIGLQGAGPQQAAIQALQNSPQFAALVQQGEEGILQNAAATGGLRGGNVQAALAQFRPQVLSQLIQSQFQNLGGLAQLGQASAAGQASAGMGAGANIADLLQQSGAAQAGGVLAKGNMRRQVFSDVLGGARALGGFF